MLGLRGISLGTKAISRLGPRRARYCALAAALALPLTLSASEGLIATVSDATPAGASVATGPQPSILLPTMEATYAEAAVISRSGHDADTVEVSSPKGSRTWSASSLTDNGLPSAARAAYVRAAEAMAGIDPACQLPWTLLAGVGRVESDHGRYGGSVLGNDGVSHPLIIGVPLNGIGPVAAIRDTDNGRLDKDKVWDRAVGPMQFIPSTWAGAARDGDGDGVESPNDIDDAALAAAAYLCSGSGSVLGESAMSAAIFRYNASDEYVALVMAMERGYRTGVFVMPASVVAEDRVARPKRKHRSDKGQRGGDGKQGPAGTSSGGTSSGGTSSGGGTAPSPNPSGGSSTSGGGGGGGKAGDGTSGGGKGGDGKSGDSPSNPTPSPTPTPTPTPEPKPTLAPCGTDWCLGGDKLELGGADKLAQPAKDDYDGDGSVESNQQELEGLSGTPVIVVITSGSVTQIQGMPYV